MKTPIFVLLFLCSLTALHAAPPANDNYANRVVVVGNDVVANATLSEATAEANERNADGTVPTAGSSLDPSVWYEWTCTSGSFLVTALPTAADTGVAATAWVGGPLLPSLVPVGSCANGTFKIRATSGTKFYFQLTSGGNNWGAFRFEIHALFSGAGNAADFVGSGYSAGGSSTVNITLDLLNLSMQEGEWLDRGVNGFPTPWDTPAACGWVKWTAPASGLYSATVFGAGRPPIYRDGDIPVEDVRVDVLTFGVGGAITRHNSPLYETQWSAVAGTTYTFRVGTHRSQEWLTEKGSTVSFHISPSGPTDSPGGSSATITPGGLATVSIAGLGAEIGTSTDWIHPTSYDAWVRVLGTIGGEFEARLESGPGFRLQVYGKDSGGTYHLTGSGTAETPHVRFSARSDRSYVIRVQMVDSTSYTTTSLNAVKVGLTNLAGASRPANDHFSTAAFIGSSETSFLSSVVLKDATTEEGEDKYAAFSGNVLSLPHRSVWYSYTATSNHDVRLSATDHAGNRVPITVATGTLGNFTHVSYGDFTAITGTTYRIRVDLETERSCPWVTFRFSRLAQSVDDNFPGIGSTASSQNVLIPAYDSTTQSGETTYASENGSVWRTWTPTASGSAVVTTFGSDFDTVLRIYTGSAVNALTLVAENDDSEIRFRSTSGVRLNVTSGTAYRIRISGYSSQSGLVALRIRHEGIEGAASPPTYWAQHFPGISSALLTDPNADTDGDGLRNGVEMALNTEPLVSLYDPCSNKPATSPVQAIFSGSTLRFIYPRPSSILTDLTSSDRDWICVTETSTDLTNWTTTPALYESGTDSYKLTLPLPVGQKRFARLWVGDPE